MLKAKWITRDIIEPDMPYGGPAGAKWVWAWEYCRVHAKKEFICDSAAEYAKAYFVCDNYIDLYINGQEVTLSGNSAEVTGLIKKGKNIIAVRAYQTDKPERFLSAFRGGITIKTIAGDTIEILTDSSWKQLRLSDFGQGKEIDNWQTENVGESAREERFEHLKEFSHHPSVLRRSSVFSKSFTVDKMPEKAVLRGSAYGLWQPYINGKTVNLRLMPGTMEKRKEFQEFSILDLLKSGENQIRVILGNGWYNCECFGILDAKKPCFIGEIELIYSDGSTEVIATDESWKVSPSKIYEDDLQYGERVDARIDDTVSSGNTILANIDVPLVKQDYPMMGISEHLFPERVSSDGEGRVFDFGYNFAGRAKFKFYNTVPGQKFVIRYYEFINSDGRYNLHTYSDVFYPCESDKGGRARYAVKNLDFYIAKGAECEEYEPIFTYTGLRYAIVYGLAENQKCDAEGLVINALLKDKAVLSTSCGFIEKLWDMAYKTWKGNIFSGPTDCPSREKNYWNGDMLLFAHAACWCTDNSDFLARWTEYGRKIEYGVYGWEDEEYILPWVLYEFYGETEVLENKYDTIVNLMKNRGVFRGDVLPVNPHSPYCDHLTCGKNIDKQLFSDAYYCLMLNITSKISDVIGKINDHTDFEARYNESRAAFQKRYVDNPLLCDNPASIVLALAFGLFDEEYALKLAERLDWFVRENDYKLITGFHSTRYILDVLCDYGYVSTAWKLVSQTEYPSWLYIADTGSATYTEGWEGMNIGETMLSMNHFTPGAFTSWFFEYLGGIRITKSSPGLEHVYLEPVFIDDIECYSVETNTKYGKIISSWHKNGSGFDYIVAIPKGMTATVNIGGIAKELAAEDCGETGISMLDKYPELKAMYNPDVGNTRVFYFENAR